MVFEQVYRAEFDYVCRSLQRLGAESRDLNDLLQEVFLAVHLRLHTYDPARPLRPWLFGIAFRVLSDSNNRARRKTEVSDAVLAEVPVPPRAEQLIEEKQARDLVLTALQKLQPDQRAVFVMHELDECAVPQIAEALEIPVNTAYSRLRLARADFVAAVRRLQPQGEAR
jgi:RNA polymerase sigma-70 factor (ECF subfamily)